MKKSHITYGFSSNKIEYYSCWEDIEVIQKALKIQKDDIILSITSAGCNILNFLLYNPKKIISIDFNPYQNYLLELKIKAIKNLNYNEFLNLLGIEKSNDSIKIYKKFRLKLDIKTRLFWDSNLSIIKRGLIYIGEPDVKAFGKFLRFLKGKGTLEGLFVCKTINEQLNYFYKNIYGFPWRLSLRLSYNIYLFRIILCIRILNQFHYKKKKSSELLKYIKRVTYPKNPQKKLEFIFTKTPIINNYFASLMLLNLYYNEKFFPPYLKKKSFPILKERINKIQIKTISLENILKDLPDNSITKFNLSNIFDWFDNKEFKKMLLEIFRVGTNRSRIFYTSTRNNRSIPINIKNIITEKELESKLLKTDRTVLYSNFHVGKIIK